MKQGLSHRFYVRNGKFTFSSGPSKLRDNLFFLLSFDTIVRIYMDDFSPKLLWLVQKHSSFIESYKIIMLGRLKKIVLKYVPDIKIDSLNILSNRATGDKSFEVVLNYRFINAEGEEQSDTTVKFI